MSTKVKNVLHVFSSYEIAAKNAFSFSKEEGLDLDVKNLFVIQGDTRNMFVCVKDKADAYRFGGIPFDQIYYYNGYEKEIPEDVYNFLESRKRKLKDAKNSF